MKKILRFYLTELISLLIASRIAEGLLFKDGYKTIFIASLALALTSLIAKPVINIMLIPLNLITFGMFKWISSAVALYLVTLLVKDFSIMYFKFYGFSSAWFDVPSVHFTGIVAFISFSLIISVISSTIGWLNK